VLKYVAVCCCQGLGGKTRLDHAVSMFYSVLQGAAKYCSVQQCVALSRAVAALYLFCGSVLQCVAVCCQYNVLQCVATRQHTATHCNTLYCNTLLLVLRQAYLAVCDAVCYNVLQCVAVCCQFL